MKLIKKRKSKKAQQSKSNLTTLTIFNPDGRDHISDRQIWGGSTTGIMNLNNVKFKWAVKLYKQMRDNLWIPEKVDMSMDLQSYKSLTEDEKNSYDGILSYLVFLDSQQTTNLAYIKNTFTAPEIGLCINEQISQETNHSSSYQLIIESILEKEQRDQIYDFWRSDPVLRGRCNYIASLYQEWLDDRRNEEKYFYSLLADYLLESIYFYMGFNFFHNLASRHMMICSNDMIKYIRKDELTHVYLFQKIIVAAMEVFPYSLEKIYSMFNEAIKQEINWMGHITKDNILGMSQNATTEYLKWLGNQRLKAIGLEPLYKEDLKNKYIHLERIADESNSGYVKSNFFDSTVTSYNTSTVIDGWNDF